MIYFRRLCLRRHSKQENMMLAALYLFYSGLTIVQQSILIHNVTFAAMIIITITKQLTN